MIFTINDDRRHTSDPILTNHMPGLTCFTFDGEGIKARTEFLFTYALFGKKFSQGSFVIQLTFILMNRLEKRGVNLIEHAQGFGSIVSLCMKGPIWPKNGWHTL